MTVAGVVTAEAGRILSDKTLIIQDATGGIAVGVPSDATLPVRGDAVSISGELVAPYGNLEVRTTHASDFRLIGRDSLPTPKTLTSDGLGEAEEGRLARIGGTLTSIDASPSGSLTLMIEDAHGEARVFAFERAGIDHDRLERGQRLRVTGIVGQRASASGRLDGYRLWPRDAADVVIESQPSPTPSPTPTAGTTPTPRPSPTPSPSSSPNPSGDPGTVIPIATARTRMGQTVTIAGVVTAPLGLLDSDSRRVTLEDVSGAILVRLASGNAAVAVGDRLRVSGEVGTYYGATQLGATDMATVIGHGPATAGSHAGGALGAADEWRLIRVSGTVHGVHRDGDGWHAELALGDGTLILVTALPRATIPSTALADGGQATVTGIARPPYPTASDRRLAVLPRTSADVSGHAPPGGASPTPGSSPSGTGTGGPASDTGGGSGSGSTGGPSASGSPQPPSAQGSRPPYDGHGGFEHAGPNATAPGVRIADLASYVGQRVTLGGLVVSVTAAEIELDDGTGRTVLRLGPNAAAEAPALTPGTAINATGTVTADPDGTLYLAVALSGDIVPASDLGSGLGVSGTTGAPTSGAARGGPAAGPDGPGGPGLPVGLLAALLVAILGAGLLIIGAWPGSARRLPAARRLLARCLGRSRERSSDPATDQATIPVTAPAADDGPLQGTPAGTA